MVVGVVVVGAGEWNKGMRKVRKCSEIEKSAEWRETAGMSEHTEKTVEPRWKANLTGGNRKGIPNKLTVSIREAIERAFDKLGGQDYLVHVGRTDPRTFCALLSKLLPTKLANADGSPILTALTALSDAELEARTALALANAQRSGVLPSPAAPLLDVQAEVVPAQSPDPKVDATQSESEVM